MTITNIVAGVNTKLAGERLTFNQLRLFLSETIDDINAALNSEYPSFDALDNGDSYDYFPDQYIRSVVINGAAYKYYVTDDEGIETSIRYGYEYRDRLFIMKRDFAEQVPEEYQAMCRGYLSGSGVPDVEYSSPFVGW